MILLCTDQGFSFLLEQGKIYRGQVLVWQGETQQGIALIRQSLDSLYTLGVDPAPDWLVRLAEVYTAAGAVPDGFSALAEALEAIEQTGERTCEAEVYRLKGELALQESKARPELSRRVQSSRFKVEEEVEEISHTAIAIAQKQSAKSWELRAAVSLARLWQQQGKKEEASTLLAEVYDWFTEGFDTKDLQDAQALLGELS